MKLLEIANKLLLQWFFIRLVECKKTTAYIDYTLDHTEDGSFYTLKADEPFAEKDNKLWYAIVGWVPPLIDCERERERLGDTWGHWRVRVSAIRQVKEPLDEQQWLKYLENCNYNYTGIPYICDGKTIVIADLCVSKEKIIREWGKIIHEQNIITDVK